MGGERERPDNGETVATTDRHSPEAVVRLLTNEQSRLLLSILTDRGGTVPVDELAERLAASKRAELADEAPAARHVRARLRHVVLPMLADTGVLTYDRKTEAVTLTGRGTGLEPYLASIRENGRYDTERA